jgi:hypothetical protein
MIRLYHKIHSRVFGQKLFRSPEFPSQNMKLRLICFLLACAGASAHLRHSHHQHHPHHKTYKNGKTQVIHLDSHTPSLPVKTNRSTIDWENDEQTFRLGDHQFKSLKEFKKRARCGTKEPPKHIRIASHYQTEAYLKAQPRYQTEAYLKAQPQSTANFSTPAILIQVYFHCMKSGNDGGCNGAAINKQIDVLNAAYAPDFRFNVSSALVYDRPEFYKCNSSNTTQERLMKEEMHQGGMSTLNIYTCSTTELSGWGYFPDGSAGGGSCDV